MKKLIIGLLTTSNILFIATPAFSLNPPHPVNTWNLVQRCSQTDSYLNSKTDTLSPSCKWKLDDETNDSAMQFTINFENPTIIYAHISCTFTPGADGHDQVKTIYGYKAATNFLGRTDVIYNDSIVLNADQTQTINIDVVNPYRNDSVNIVFGLSSWGTKWFWDSAWVQKHISGPSYAANDTLNCLIEPK